MHLTHLPGLPATWTALARHPPSGRRTRRPAAGSAIASSLGTPEHSTARCWQRTTSCQLPVATGRARDATRDARGGARLTPWPTGLEFPTLLLLLVSKFLQVFQLHMRARPRVSFCLHLLLEAEIVWLEQVIGPRWMPIRTLRRPWSRAPLILFLHTACRGHPAGRPPKGE